MTPAAGLASVALPQERPALPQLPAGASPTRVREAAIRFEASFLSAMLAPMFESLPTDGPFGGGEAEGQWRGLLVEQYADSIARSGGIGLADTVARELLALQEGSAG